jgi:hypothetical protein
VDPIAVQAVSRGAAPRPPVDPHADPAQVLREGRVLAGEVLAKLDGGTLLIGVGNHRVPAKAQVDLEPGQRFLFRVAVESGGLLLEVLEERSALEPRLISALRSVAAGSGALGRVLGELVSLLRRGAAERGPGAERLAAALGSHLPPPDAGARALAQAASRVGLGHEARLADAALADLGPKRQALLGRELAGSLRSRLLEGLPAVHAARLEQALKSAVAAALADPGRPLGLAALARGLSAELALTPEQAARAYQGLRDALPQGLGRIERGFLAAWLGLPPGAEASVLLAEAGGDLKADLLRGLAELPEGALRGGVERVLEALENEQLLNVARARANDAMHLLVALRDGERATPLHLFVKPDAEETPGRPADPVHRLALAVEFEHTGLLWADLAVRAESVALRIGVSRPAVLELLERHRGELEARLAHGGRRVRLALVLAPAEELLAERGLSAIRYLSERAVLDQSG